MVLCDKHLENIQVLLDIEHGVHITILDITLSDIHCEMCESIGCTVDVHGFEDLCRLEIVKGSPI